VNRETEKNRKRAIKGSKRLKGKNPPYSPFTKGGYRGIVIQADKDNKRIKKA